MVDLEEQLQRLADEGASAGATEVMSRARGDLATRATARPRARRRRTVLALAAAVAVAAVVVLAVVSLSGTDGDDFVAGRQATTAEALASEETDSMLVYMERLEDGLTLVDVDRETVEPVDELIVGVDRSFEFGCATCPLVRQGSTLFFLGNTDPDPALPSTHAFSLRYPNGPVEDLGPVRKLFPAADGSNVLITWEVPGEVVLEFAPDGSTVAGPWDVPDGYTLPQSRGIAVANGILVGKVDIRTIDQIGFNLELAVWNPSTGDVGPSLGRARRLIDTFNDPDTGRSLVAWTRDVGDCLGCVLVITDVTTGTSTEIDKPGEFGFLHGGAFSPRGRSLATFLALDSGSFEPHAKLAIVDTVTGALTEVEHSETEIGEPYGYATWAPSGDWLFFGGGDPNLLVHRAGTTDAVPLSLPANYSTVAISRPSLPGWASLDDASDRAAVAARVRVDEHVVEPFPDDPSASSLGWRLAVATVLESYRGDLEVGETVSVWYDTAFSEGAPRFPHTGRTLLVPEPGSEYLILSEAPSRDLDSDGNRVVFPIESSGLGKLTPEGSVETRYESVPFSEILAVIRSDQ